MSSPSEQPAGGAADPARAAADPVTLVVIGAVDDPLLTRLIAAGGEQPAVVALTGTAAEGRRLLELAAGPGPVIYSPWPTAGGAR